MKIATFLIEVNNHLDAQRMHTAGEFEWTDNESYQVAVIVAYHSKICLSLCDAIRFGAIHSYKHL